MLLVAPSEIGGGRVGTGPSGPVYPVGRGRQRSDDRVADAERLHSTGASRLRASASGSVIRKFATERLVK